MNSYIYYLINICYFILLIGLEIICFIACDYFESKFKKNSNNKFLLFIKKTMIFYWAILSLLILLILIPLGDKTETDMLVTNYKEQYVEKVYNPKFEDKLKVKTTDNELVSLNSNILKNLDNYEDAEKNPQNYKIIKKIYTMKTKFGVNYRTNELLLEKK